MLVNRHACWPQPSSLEPPCVSCSSGNFVRHANERLRPSGGVFGGVLATLWPEACAADSSGNPHTDCATSHQADACRGDGHFCRDSSAYTARCQRRKAARTRLCSRLQVSKTLSTSGQKIPCARQTFFVFFASTEAAAR